MKKLIFSSLFLLGTMGHAQINYGMKGGVSITNAEYSRYLLLSYRHLTPSSEVYKASSAVGGYLGVWTEFKILPKYENLYLQLESLFGINRIEINNEKEAFLWVNIPVILKYQLKENISIGSGLSAGFRNVDLVDRGDMEKGEDKIIAPSSIHLDAIISAEYKISKNLSADARYNIGFRDKNSLWKSNSLQLGLKLNLGF